jgi:hypothetical protein
MIYDLSSCVVRDRLKASELLLALQPGNLSGFAAIFMGGFLQAARTGEAILDDQLASLEQKDPSRFQRLSQRFHAKPGAAGGGGGSNRRVCAPPLRTRTALPLKPFRSFRRYLFHH